MRMPHRVLTGTLLASQVPGAEPFPAWETISGISEAESPTSGWRFLVLKSKTPLVREFGGPNSEFFYPYLCRESGAHAVLVSTHMALIKVLLSRTGVSGSVSAPRIRIAELIDHFLAQPHDRYAVSRVFAKVDGHGESVRSIALYGADVIETSFFRELRPTLNPFRAQFRDLTTGAELMSIASRGEVSFFYDGARSLSAVVEILSFLNAEKLIMWPS